jgi:hypothetical protein
VDESFAGAGGMNSPPRGLEEEYARSWSGGVCSIGRDDEKVDLWCWVEFYFERVRYYVGVASFKFGFMFFVFNQIHTSV